MAERRMILALALVACRADAQPANGPAIPSGWRALPELAATVGSAAGARDRTQAWGEPAMGCYAVSLALAGRASAADDVAAVLRAAGFAVTDATTTGDVATLAFARGDYHGRARANVGDGATLVACFWNDREPDACARACDAIIGAAR
jgi:hypothetical protein